MFGRSAQSPTFHRVEVVVTFYCRILDHERFGSVLLASLSKLHQVEACRRLGHLNVLNLVSLPGFL